MLDEGHLSLSFSLLMHIIFLLSLINYFVPKPNYTVACLPGATRDIQVATHACLSAYLMLGDNITDYLVLRVTNINYLAGSHIQTTFSCKASIKEVRIKI